MDILIFIVSFLVFSGFGKRVISLFRLDIEEAGERLVYSIALGYGLAGYIVYIMGLTGLIYRQYLWGLLLVLFIFSFRDTVSVSLQIGRSIRASFYKLFERDVPVFNKLVILFIFTAIAATFIGALMPPLGNDSLAYRMAQVRIYADSHRVSYVPFSRESLWPNLTEMLFTFGLVMGSDILVKIFAWSFGIVSALAVFFVSKRLFSGAAAIVAAAMFLLTPAIFSQMTYAYVDIPMALYSFLFLAAFIRFTKKNDLRWAVLAGIFAGFVMSVKYSGVIVMGSMAMVALYSMVKAGDKKVFFKGLAVMAVFCFMFSFSWYFRAFIVKGNPVYPYLPDVFSGNGWYRNAEGLVGSAFSPLGAFLIPWDTAMNPARFGGENLGVYFLVFAPLALFIREKKRYAEFMIFAIGYIIVWLFVDPYVLRFIFPALLPIAILTGGGVDSALRMDRLVSAAVKTVFIVISVLSIGILGYRTVPAAKVALHLETRSDYLSRKERTYDVSEYIRENLPENAKLLLVDEIRVYYMERPYIHLRNLIDEEKIDPARVNSGKFIEDIRGHNVDYIVHIQGGRVYPWIDALAAKGNVIHRNTNRGSDGEIYTYEVIKVEDQ